MSGKWWKQCTFLSACFPIFYQNTVTSAFQNEEPPFQNEEPPQLCCHVSPFSAAPITDLDARPMDQMPAPDLANKTDEGPAIITEHAQWWFLLPATGLSTASHLLKHSTNLDRQEPEPGELRGLRRTQTGWSSWRQELKEANTAVTDGVVDLLRSVLHALNTDGPDFSDSDDLKAVCG